MPTNLRIEISAVHNLPQPEPTGNLDLTAYHTGPLEALDWAHKLMHYVCVHGTLPEVPAP